MPNESDSALTPRTDAGRATAEKGVVVLDGPDGVAVTMTADAADGTADSLRSAAKAARAQRDQTEKGLGSHGESGSEDPTE
ncbi:hypothetical protein [Polaromonas sp.]|uniref:hypothetical protein n=1 Tax=Polaromonas sp. TaxID=1869339 RepID=UPI00352AC690